MIKYLIILTNTFSNRPPLNHAVIFRQIYRQHH